MRQEDIKAPPPGPIQPIFNDPLTQIERERRMLRYRASQLTSPEAVENVKGAASVFSKKFGKLPGVTKSLPPKPRAPQPGQPAQPINRQPQPTAKPMSNLIMPVNAQGAPIADPRPAPPKPKLSFSPAPDGTFCKVADRPRPTNLPLDKPWTQKYLATHENQPFAIAMDGNVAKLLSDALNTYFAAVLQHQAEAEARTAAAAAAANDATAFDGHLAEGGEVDAITGVPAAAVGEPSEIENLPSL